MVALRKAFTLTWICGQSQSASKGVEFANTLAQRPSLARSVQRLSFSTTSSTIFPYCMSMLCPRTDYRTKWHALTIKPLWTTSSPAEPFTSQQTAALLRSQLRVLLPRLLLVKAFSVEGWLRFGQSCHFDFPTEDMRKRWQALTSINISRFAITTGAHLSLPQLKPLRALVTVGAALLYESEPAQPRGQLLQSLSNSSFYERSTTRAFCMLGSARSLYVRRSSWFEWSRGRRLHLYTSLRVLCSSSNLVSSKMHTPVNLEVLGAQTADQWLSQPRNIIRTASPRPAFRSGSSTLLACVQCSFSRETSNLVSWTRGES